MYDAEAKILSCGIAENGSCGKGRYWPCFDRFERQRLYYVMSSQAVFLDGIREYPLKPGHLYLFPCNLEFVVRQESDERMNLLFFDFITTPLIVSDKPYELAVSRGTALYGLIETLAALFCEHSDDHPVWWFLRNDGGDWPVQRMVRELFGALLIRVSELCRISYRNSPKIQQSVEYINAHYHEPLSVAELADRLFLCKDHYTRLFREYMHLTPHQYIVALRINEARQLLQGGATYEAAAHAVGFDSGSSLHRCLQKKSAYRQ